jgi:hypothetical protein
LFEEFKGAAARGGFQTIMNCPGIAAHLILSLRPRPRIVTMPDLRVSLSEISGRLEHLGYLVFHVL